MDFESRERYELHRRVVGQYFPAWRGSCSAPQPTEFVEPDWSFLPAGGVHWFLEALDRGVVEITDLGLPKLPSSRHTFLFERSGPQARIYREGYFEVAAAGMLALQFGWSADRLAYQAPRRGVAQRSDARQWSFDLLAYADDDRTEVAIAGEVKWQQRDAVKLAQALERCALRGEHHEDECGETRNSHRKYIGLLEFKPCALWIIGPDAFSESPSLVFQVQLKRGGVALAAAGPEALAAASYM